MKTLIIFALSAVSLFGQGALAPVPLQQPLGNAGQVLIGSCLYTYATGSTTPLATYSNAILTVENTNPIVLNSSGRAPAIFLSPVSYKFVLGQRFANACPATPGTVIWSQDPVFDAGQSLKVALALPTGAGLVGYSYGTSYAAGTVGKAIQDAVNFSQSATYLAGTSSKHLQQDSINPMDAPYNAACNNSADDTTAIQTAVNAAAARQVTFRFPGVGYCRITGPITISTAKTTMVGSGPHSGLAASAANFNLIEVDADDFTARDFALIGAAVDGTNTQFGVFTDVAHSPQKGKLENIYVSATNNGFKLDNGVNGWHILNPIMDHLYGIAAGRGYGILVAGNNNVVSGGGMTGIEGIAGRHGIYNGAGGSFNKYELITVDTFNSSNFVDYSTTAQPSDIGNIFAHNISRNAKGLALGIAGAAAFESTGNVVGSIHDGNEVYNSELPAWSLDDQNLGSGVMINNQENNYIFTGNPHTVGGTGSSYCGRIGGAVNTLVLGGIYSGVSNGATGTYPCFVVAPANQGTVGADVSDGTRFVGVQVIYNADLRASIQINPTLPVPTNTTLTGNTWSVGTQGDIENPSNVAILRGINLTTGTTAVTTDINPLVMPHGYTVQGGTASSCTSFGADACDFGSDTNNFAVRGISGKATTKNQGLKICNTDTGGDCFTFSESLLAKKFTLRGVTNSNIWHFNDLLPAAGGGGFESSGFTSIGTKFTVSGCSADTTAGGATAGSFLSRSSTTCTFVITMAGATGLTAGTGWTCSADDITTGTHLPQTASTTTTCSVTGATTTGDKVQFMAISF